MKNLLQKLSIRLQNPKVIIATISGVLLILSNTGIVTVEHANYMNDILNTFLSMFVGLGVFGNPESHVPPNKEELIKSVLEALANTPAKSQTAQNNIQQVQVVPVTPSVLSPVPPQTPVQQ